MRKSDPRMLSNLAFRIFMMLRAVWSPTVMGVGAAVFDTEGRILLVKQRYGHEWRLPMGGVARGEPAQIAVVRELSEEVGLTGGAAELFGLYSSQVVWATAVVAFYLIRGAAVKFRPSLEVREIRFIDPLSPPDDCAPATLRRLKELTGAMALSPYW
jgi:ADP-ribose pyrophosphatase YjhB (NUDIX family)